MTALTDGKKRDKFQQMEKLKQNPRVEFEDHYHTISVLKSHIILTNNKS